MFDLVSIGHVARDEFEGEPDWRLGGTALYSAAAAARLGARTALLTRVGPGERERLRLRARAKGLAADAVPEALWQTRSVVFGSIAHELDPSLFAAFAAVPRVVAAQGYLRTWDADGTIRRRDWDEAADVLRRVSVAVVSEDDIEADLDLARRWSQTAPVLVTLAERGAVLLGRGREIVVEGFRAERVVDPTGAGDAFCAGLALSLAEGDQLETAARFANAVASFAVEDVGLDGLATRDRVESRLRAHPSPSTSSSSGGGKTA